MGAILNNRFVKWVLAPVAVVGILFGGLWAYYQNEYPTCTFRYKLTAEVQTPNGVKTGSSVVEVSYSHSADWGGGEHGVAWATGEAVYIDLGQGKNLFILLTNSETGSDAQSDGRKSAVYLKGFYQVFSLPIKIYGLTWNLGEERQLCRDLAAASATKNAEISFGNLPTLVTFTDIRDPSTVKVVRPDSFETDFGKGYRFLDAKIDSTTDLPSHNIEQILVWWNDYKPAWIHRGWAINDPLILRLGYNAFRAYQKSDDGGK